MPTYEYRCPKGHTFDVFQKMSDPAEATCPECGKPAERQISAGAGFLFKGEGFYITDYRSKDYKEKASRERPGGGGGADAPKGGSESSPSTPKEKPSGGDKSPPAEAPKKKSSSGGDE